MGLSESLLGRYELIRVNHWDAYESHLTFGWDLEMFLKFGGYPAAARLVDDKERWVTFMRDSVIEPIISKDILALKQINNTALFRQTFELAMSYPAQEISYQKLLGHLQDKGNAGTVKSYLQLLEKAFTLRILEKYSNQPIRIKSSSPKLVPLAPALIHAFTPNRVERDPKWRGRVFESSVIAKANTLPGAIYYWRSGSHEVDLVWSYEDRLFGLEIKSGAGKRSSGLVKFREKYPNARTLLLDSDLAGEFLISSEPLKLMLSYYDCCAGS